MNIIGKRFGRLTVMSQTEEYIHGSVAWICKCDCGNYIKASTRDLNRGAVKSCGCLKKERYDIVGQRFGKLTVIKKETLGSHCKFLCQCDCGSLISVRGDSLKSGKTVSCGCAKKSDVKAKQLESGRALVDHTSPVFFKGTVSKNSRTGINGVTIVKGKYVAYIGYKNKTYRLVTTDDIKIAQDVRKEADEAVKNGEFEQWIDELKKERKNGK